MPFFLNKCETNVKFFTILLRFRSLRLCFPIYVQFDLLCVCACSFVPHWDKKNQMHISVENALKQNKNAYHVPIDSKACCLEFLLGLTARWHSFIAFSIMDTGYGR
jgi:hypothetical protein